MNVLINVIKLIIDSNNASVQLTKKKVIWRMQEKQYFGSFAKQD